MFPLFQTYSSLRLHFRRNKGCKYFQFLTVIFLLFLFVPQTLAESLNRPHNTGSKTVSSLAAYQPSEPGRATEGNWRYLERGIASWYGPAFHGRPTASGEIYDQTAMTAAHPRLPFGSQVRVTNRLNKRTVRLVVNDRGPNVPGRIIDVSYRAAQKLGMIEQGTTEVEIETLGDITPLSAVALTQASLPNKAGCGPELVYVQVGAFENKQNAAIVDANLRHLAPMTIDSVEMEGQRLHRVRLGPFQDQQRAHSVLTAVSDAGFHEATLIREK